MYCANLKNWTLLLTQFDGKIRNGKWDQKVRSLVHINNLARVWRESAKSWQEVRNPIKNQPRVSRDSESLLTTSRDTAKSQKGYQEQAESQKLREQAESQPRGQKVYPRTKWESQLEFSWEQAARVKKGNLMQVQSCRRLSHLLSWIYRAFTSIKGKPMCKEVQIVYRLFLVNCYLLTAFTFELCPAS